LFSQITDRFDSIFRSLRGLGKINDANIQKTVREIRRVLLEADVNFEVSKTLIERIKTKAAGTKVFKSIKPGEQFIKIIRDELVKLLGSTAKPLELGNHKPAVIMMVGLQGSGKTTSCVKLAHLLKGQGKTVLLAAADIYRPGAIKQLQIAAQEIKVPVYEEGATDPVLISSHAVEEAVNAKIDVLIVDTAGRLHVDGEMMNEIQSIADQINPVEILFVVDGMTGQDAVNSASAFSAALPLSGTILTKMDGDARGGVAISMAEATGTPVKFIGVSEKYKGLEVFDPARMVDRILGFGDIVSLVEKAQDAVDLNSAKDLEQKIRSNTFDLEDFKVQLKQLQKMGPINQIAGIIPGLNRKMIKNMDIDDRQMAWTEAIINSMTVYERQHPGLINGSRRRRIAQGSGRSVQEVNQLLKQFSQMQIMMKKMGKMKMPKHLKNQMMGIN